MRAAYILLLVASCVHSAAVTCGDVTCPQGSTCGPADICIPAGCGNGEVAGTEECDTTVTGQDCTEYGYYAREGLTCSPICTIDTTTCTGGRCGDHVRNGPEACDGIPMTDVSCIDVGFQIGRLSCSPGCGVGFAECDRIGWHGAPTDATQDMFGVWLNLGGSFAVGAGGQILHSDGGPWLQMPSPTTVDLLAVWGTGPKNVFAVGSGGTILHYDGTTWTTMVSNTTVQLRGVSGTGPNDVIAVGGAGTIVTYDGTAWTVTSNVVPNYLDAVYGGANNGVIVGENKTVLVRSGSTWQPVTVPAATAHLNDVVGFGTVAYIVGTTGYTAADQGLVFRLQDTTLTPVTLPDPVGRHLLGVWGSSATDVYAVGRLGTIYHFDGTNVVIEPTDTTRSIVAVDGIGAGTAVAVGRGGNVEAFNGFDREVVPPKSTPEQWWDVAWVGTTLFAVGDDTTSGFARYRSGATWATVALPGSTGPLYSVWGSAARGATYFTGDTGIYMYTTGTATQSVPGVRYNAVWGASAGTAVYAVAATGELAYSANGSTWTTTTITTVPLHGVWTTADGSVAFAVGDAGTILRGSGTTWTAMDSGTNMALNGVWGTSATDVYAIGYSGVVLHYDGATWRTMETRTAETLLAIDGTQGGDVFVVGSAGFAMHFDGTSWSPIARGNFDLPSVAASAGEVAFAASVGGLERLTRAKTEERCSDAWDNDQDGAVNCADSDCKDNLTCLRGGVCETSALAMCGATIAGSTFTGNARVDDLPCLSISTPGPEASYRFIAPVTGSVTATISDATAPVSIVAVETLPGTAACDLSTCVSPSPTGSGSVTFNVVAGRMYHLLVDGPAYIASDFSLTIDCP